MRFFILITYLFSLNLFADTQFDCHFDNNRKFHMWTSGFNLIKSFDDYYDLNSMAIHFNIVDFTKAYGGKAYHCSNDGLVWPLRCKFKNNKTRIESVEKISFGERYVSKYDDHGTYKVMEKYLYINGSNAENLLYPYQNVICELSSN